MLTRTRTPARCARSDAQRSPSRWDPSHVRRRQPPSTGSRTSPHCRRAASRCCSNPYVKSIAELLEARGREFDVVHRRPPLHRREAPRRHPPLRAAGLVAFDTGDLPLPALGSASRARRRPAAKAAARAQPEENSAYRRADVTSSSRRSSRGAASKSFPRPSAAAVEHPRAMKGGKPLAEREGIVFIGGFQHPPQRRRRALVRARSAAWVRRACRVKTLSSSAASPSTIARWRAPTWWSPGTCPMSSRSSPIAGCRSPPLRYGAGVKGKVNLAMSYGVPVVATDGAVSRAASGAGEDVMVAGDAEQFAQAIERVYRDESLWQRLSEAGVENVPALPRARSRGCPCRTCSTGEGTAPRDGGRKLVLARAPGRSAGPAARASYREAKQVQKPSTIVEDEVHLLGGVS